MITSKLTHYTTSRAGQIRISRALCVYTWKVFPPTSLYTCEWGILSGGVLFNQRNSSEETILLHNSFPTKSFSPSEKRLLPEIRNNLTCRSLRDTYVKAIGNSIATRHVHTNREILPSAVRRDVSFLIQSHLNPVRLETDTRTTELSLWLDGWWFYAPEIPKGSLPAS